MFGYDTDAIFDVVRKVLTRLASWIWDKIKGFLLDHWRESAIVILVLAVVSMLKLLLQGLANRVFSTF